MISGISSSLIEQRYNSVGDRLAHLGMAPHCCSSARVLSESSYAVDSEIVYLISRPNSQWVISLLWGNDP